MNAKTASEGTSGEHRGEVASAEDRRLEGLAEMFRALGDPNRLRILAALAEERLCVCEISRRLGLSPSGVSHQLRVLRSLRLVRGKREGKHVYYQVDDSCVGQLVSWGLIHAGEHEGSP